MNTIKVFINKILDKTIGYQLSRVDRSIYTFGYGENRPDLYKHIPNDLTGKMLDIGSAYGSWAQKKYGKESVVTFDQQGSADVRGDIHHLPFPDQSFDVIFCFEVLEHVKEPWVAVNELHRVLKPSGVVYCSTPFSHEIHGEEYGDYYRYTRQGLCHLFETVADFKDVKIISFGAHEKNPHHYLVIGNKK